MAATPPFQARRILTPPSPLHGPLYDDYEPYSPRRSGRLDAKRARTGHANASLKHGSIGNTTRHKPAARRTTSQTFSPPSSPEPTISKFSSLRAPYNHQRDLSDEHMTDIEHDPAEGAASANVASIAAFPNMLLTPAKTPRKKPLHQDSLRSTARILFTSRPSDPNDVMPTPRKARQNRAQLASALDNRAEPYAMSKAQKTHIFTDSKERVPEADGSEDNPFVTGQGKRRTRSHGRIRSGLGDAVDRAVENNEGLVYTFRGKKVFRRFDDVASESTSNDRPPSLTDYDLLHRAEGSSSGRLLTRSSLAPRLLFPPPKSPSPDGTGFDEEALTDIEGSDSSPEVEVEIMPATPHNKHYRPTTPPTTARKTRLSARVFTPGSSPVEADNELDLAGSVQVHAKKSSPFDGWPRTKPASRSVSAKRTAEPLDTSLATVAKRTRNASSRFH